VAAARILIIDDEPAVRFGITDFLESQGFAIQGADTVESAQAAFRDFRPDVAIADYRLPDGTALDLLPLLKEMSVPVVVLTAHGSIDLAVRAIKMGAEQFLTKPIELPALLLVLQRLLEDQRTRRKQLARRASESRTAVDPFVGASAVIRTLEEEARKVLASGSPILIQGETGTGKGVLARWLHDQGPRTDEPFVDMNCASLSREFLETELFGHEKGAFTGASARKPGLLEIAHRGTLFLDEIGDMDPQVQPKLLTVLEEKRFRRLAGLRDQRVDVRLIAATHQDLSALVKERRFRSDLYFRISTIPLLMPPLRARREDIPILARGFVEEIGREVRRTAVTLSPEAERALVAHPWPGNIRELRNAVERAVLLSSEPVLDAHHFHLPFHADDEGSVGDPALTLAEVERRHIEAVLRHEGGHVERSAARLGVPRSSLYEKLRRYGIVLPRSGRTV
jgi:DNA-binding NtrC family response regulator